MPASEVHVVRKCRILKVGIGSLAGACLLLFIGIFGDLFGLAPSKLCMFLWLAVGILITCVLLLVAILSPGQGSPVFTRLKLVNLASVPFKAKTEQSKPPLVEPKPPAPEVVAPPHSSNEVVAPPGMFFYACVEELTTTITRGNPDFPDPPANTTTFVHGVPPGSGGAILAQDLTIETFGDIYRVKSQLWIQFPGDVLRLSPSLWVDLN